ncbi:ParA family protein [Turneriella parva]|nr:AAA family ATPase [Turneriella parva]
MNALDAWSNRAHLNKVGADVIAIANQKGGEGKTTTSINLAHGLSLAGKRTLLVDMDPQGNSSGIFTDIDSLTKTVADLFTKKYTAQEIIVSTRYEKLDILPAKISLAEVELSTLNVDAPYVMRDALESVKDKYDAVVIDCPPSLSIFTINALGSAGFVVIPLQAEKFSIDGIKGLQGTIEGIKRRINPELKILGALITQLKSNTVLTKTILPVIQNYFPVFNTSISTGVAVGESHLSRRSLLDYNSGVKQAKEYMAFVKEVLDGIKK